MMVPQIISYKQYNGDIPVYCKGILWYDDADEIVQYGYGYENENGRQGEDVEEYRTSYPWNIESLATGITLKANKTTRKYPAIWDTGASNTCISQKVADELGLAVQGYVDCANGLGENKVPWYRLNVVMPKGRSFCDVKVAGAVAPDREFDVTIGLDIISKGNFSFTIDPADQIKRLLIFDIP